jgi:hypothetical protein
MAYIVCISKSRNVGAPKICRNDSFQKEDKFVEVHHSPSFSKRFMLQCLQLCRCASCLFPPYTLTFSSDCFLVIFMETWSRWRHGWFAKRQRPKLKSAIQEHAAGIKKICKNLYLHSKTCGICMKLFLLEARPKDSASWLGIWQLLHWPSGIQILEVRWSSESEGNVLSLFPVSWRHSIGHLIWRDTIRFCFPSPWLIIHYPV